MIGRHLGKYELQSEIGRGGMGIVYRGYDPVLRRPVAIKVLPPQLTYDAQFVQRFRQEAVLAASLRHPGIVTIHDVGEQDGTHYIVMEYLEGQTLEGMIAQRGPMSLAQVGRILRQIADALDFAHSRGVIHRDIKPANVMIGPEGRAMLMDFGLVRAAEGTGLTRTGTVMGTPEYMSPEQALGEPVDGRSDVYSLGIVLYKMLSGKVPFSRSTPYATTYAHIHEPPPPLRQTAPGAVPAPVDAVVTRALAKRPEERYARAGLLADAFDAAVAGRTPAAVQGTRPAVDAAAPTRLIGRGATVEKAREPAPRLLPWLAAGALLLIAAAAIVWALSRPSEREIAQSQGGINPRTVAVAPSTTAYLPAATSTEAAPLAPVRTSSVTAGPSAAFPTAVTASPTALTARPTAAPGVRAASGTEASSPAPVSTATPMPTATPVPAPRLAAGQTVNVRGGPGTAYPVIGRLSAGQAYDITGKNGAGDWLQFTFDGQIGWVIANLVSVSGDMGAVRIAANIPPPPTAAPPPTRPATCAVAAGPSFARLWDRNTIGCPTGAEFGLTTAYEAFERGWMLWRQDNDRHYALFGDGTQVYYWYPAAEPPNFACAEAEALGRPRRGFSRVWCENPGVRAKIGNALGDEIGDTRPVQEFENGFMIYVKERGTVATVYNNGAWAERP